MTGDTDSHVVEVEELLVRPGTYFNPQTEVVVMVDDSPSIDQEIFNMEAYEGADWVRISDEVPVDEDALDRTLQEFQTAYHPGRARLGLRDRARAGRRGVRRGRGRAGPRTRGPGRMSDYTVVKRDEASTHERVPRLRRDALLHPRGRRRAGRDHLALDAAGTGGEGSYGHRHKDQEEIYLVVAGNLTFKVGDDVFEVGPHTAVRVASDAYRSVHNDSAPRTRSW